jgi:FMN-dependent NADH-azoreductase
MTRLLHVIASPQGPASASTEVSTVFVQAYVDAHPGVEVDTLDLWADPVPTYGPDAVAAKMAVFGGASPEGAAGEAWGQVLATIDRFTAADVYVFAVPMWNSGIPWILKHYIDTITQPGSLFGVDMEKGYFGLLSGKTAVVAYVSGVYAPGVPAHWGVDHQSTYFNDWLRFVGVTDIHELRFQPSIFPFGGPPEERRPVALAEARALAAKL